MPSPKTSRRLPSPKTSRRRRKSRNATKRSPHRYRGDMVVDSYRGVGQPTIKVNAKSKSVMLQLPTIHHKPADAWKQWAGEIAAKSDIIKGFDESIMKVVPYTVPQEFGLDLGPHISIVPAQEWDTLDEEQKQSLQRFHDTQKPMSIKTLNGMIGNGDNLYFLNGNPANDCKTNGPIIIAAPVPFDVVETLNKIRTEMNLKSFKQDYHPHISIAKITGKQGHAKFRETYMTNWPKSFPPPITDLNKMLPIC
jgi:hypothetical protein